jgi:hypothetical protein
VYRWNCVLVLTTETTSRSQDCTQTTRRRLGHQRLVRLVQRSKEERSDRHKLRRCLALRNLRSSLRKRQGKEQTRQRLPHASIGDVRRQHILDGEPFFLGFRHLSIVMKMD